MNAYPKQAMVAGTLRRFAQSLENAEVIDADTHAQMKPQLTAGSFSPGPYFRILLTGAIFMAALGLVLLLDHWKIVQDDDPYGYLTLTLIYWVSAEVVIRAFHLYHSGIEDGLLAASTLCLLITLFSVYKADTPDQLASRFAILTLVQGLFVLRYRMMLFLYGTLVASLLTLYYFLASQWGDNYLFPFVLSSFCLLPYVLGRRMQNTGNLVTKPLARQMTVTSLLLAFAFINPYFILQVTKEGGVTSADRFPLFPICLGITVLVPMLCLRYACRRRRRLFLNIAMGYLLIAILTLWFFYLQECNQNLLALLGGAALAIIALFLHRRLKSPKEGFVSFRIPSQEDFEIFGSVMKWTKRMRLQK